MEGKILILVLAICLGSCNNNQGDKQKESNILQKASADRSAVSAGMDTTVTKGNCFESVKNNLNARAILSKFGRQSTSSVLDHRKEEVVKMDTGGLGLYYLIVPELKKSRKPYAGKLFVEKSRSGVWNFSDSNQIFRAIVAYDDYLINDFLIRDNGPLIGKEITDKTGFQQKGKYLFLGV